MLDFNKEVRVVRGVGDHPSNMPNYLKMINNGLVSYNKEVRNHMHNTKVVDVTRSLHPNALVTGLFSCYLFLLFVCYFHSVACYYFCYCYCCCCCCCLDTLFE